MLQTRSSAILSLSPPPTLKNVSHIYQPFLHVDIFPALIHLGLTVHLLPSACPVPVPSTSGAVTDSSCGSSPCIRYNSPPVSLILLVSILNSCGSATKLIKSEPSLSCNPTCFFHHISKKCQCCPQPLLMLLNLKVCYFLSPFPAANKPTSSFNDAHLLPSLQQQWECRTSPFPRTSVLFVAL